MEINKISLFHEYKEGFMIFGINNHGIGFRRPGTIIKHKKVMQFKRLADSLPGVSK